LTVLRGLSLNAADVTQAITRQNVQIASGAVGAQPSPENAADLVDDVADEEVAERDLVHRPVLGDEGDDVEGRIQSFESASDSFGVVEITANFEPGTDPGYAGVEVH
jgi:multidrug efflux pump subunit AcrB